METNRDKFYQAGYKYNTYEMIWHKHSIRRLKFSTIRGIAVYLQTYIMGLTRSDYDIF